VLQPSVVAAIVYKMAAAAATQELHGGRSHYTLMHAFIGSRLDITATLRLHCGIADRGTLEPYMRSVQNAAACLFTGLGRREHKTLHLSCGCSSCQLAAGSLTCDVQVGDNGTPLA